VPHAEVLKRACLLVSHAGHGVVLKAVYYGVPMVLEPWVRDQPSVAACAEALGVAEVIHLTVPSTRLWGSIGRRVRHTPARMPDLRQSFHHLGSSAAAPFEACPPWQTSLASTHPPHS
jgi:UDP-N-acetylglucosamine:LPS N-acetylglucosamine transferase